jgi:hypothetical protein
MKIVYGVLQLAGRIMKMIAKEILVCLASRSVPRKACMVRWSDLGQVLEMIDTDASVQVKSLLLFVVIV